VQGTHSHRNLITRFTKSLLSCFVYYYNLFFIYFRFKEKSARCIDQNEISDDKVIIKSQVPGIPLTLARRRVYLLSAFIGFGTASIHM
jgi:hypothetical protein